MSDKYKEIIALQRANNDVRAKVNAWIQSNVNEDAESLQSIVMDTEGELVPALMVVGMRTTMCSTSS